MIGIVLVGTMIGRCIYFNFGKIECDVERSALIVLRHRGIYQMFRKPHATIRQLNADTRFRMLTYECDFGYSLYK